MRRFLGSVFALALSTSAALAQVGGGVANPGGLPTAPFGAFGGTPILSACGTSPTVIGNSVYGQVTTGTGTPATCQVFWTNAAGVATARQAVPVCFVVGQTTPALTMTVTTNPLVWTNAATNSAVFNYLCIGS
jgi:hypothetical protein